MQRPVSNAQWCRRWDELTTRLILELERVDCDVSRVQQLVSDRRRLTTAHPAIKNSEDELDEESQRAWLVGSLERESRLRELVVQVKDRIGCSLDSIHASGLVRSHFKDYDKVEHVFNCQL